MNPDNTPRRTRREAMFRFSPARLFGAALVVAPLFAGCAGSGRTGPPPGDVLLARQASLEEKVKGLADDVRSLSATKEELEQRFSDESLTRPFRKEMERYGERLSAIEGRVAELERRLAAVETSLRENREEWNRKMAAVLDAVREENAGLREAIGKLQKSSVSIGWEHTVAPGETLAGIAKEYGARLKDVIEANEIENPRLIRPGQKLFIPRPASR